MQFFKKSRCHRGLEPGHTGIKDKYPLANWLCSISMNLPFLLYLVYFSSVLLRFLFLWNGMFHRIVLLLLLQEGNKEEIEKFSKRTVKVGS